MLGGLLIGAGIIFLTVMPRRLPAARTARAGCRPRSNPRRSKPRRLQRLRSNLRRLKRRRLKRQRLNVQPSQSCQAQRCPWKPTAADCCPAGRWRQDPRPGDLRRLERHRSGRLIRRLSPRIPLPRGSGPPTLGSPTRGPRPAHVRLRRRQDRPWRREACRCGKRSIGSFRARRRTTNTAGGKERC